MNCAGEGSMQSFSVNVPEYQAAAVHLQRRHQKYRHPRTLGFPEFWGMPTDFSNRA